MHLNKFRGVKLNFFLPFSLTNMTLWDSKNGFHISMGFFDRHSQQIHFATNCLKLLNFFWIDQIWKTLCTWDSFFNYQNSFWQAWLLAVIDIHFNIMNMHFFFFILYGRMRDFEMKQYFVYGDVSLFIISSSSLNKSKNLFNSADKDLKTHIDRLDWKEIAKNFKSGIKTGFFNENVSILKYLDE